MADTKTVTCSFTLDRETGVWHLLITPNLNNPLFKPTKAYFFVKFFQILCGYMCLYMI